MAFWLMILLCWALLVAVVTAAFGAIGLLIGLLGFAASLLIAIEAA